MMNISTIIPIHEYKDETAALITKAVDSILNQKEFNSVNTLDIPIYIVYPTSIDENISELVEKMNKTYSGKLKLNLIKNDGKSDYQSQVNLAVDNITTEYFSVLEFDDEFSETYFKNAIKYVNTYPEVDIFLTMMIEVNDKNEAIKITNETVWAQQFVGENGEMGFLNANALKQYTDFKLSGTIIKTSEFKNLGKYKSNIKLTFMYEFLLRALNNASKIYSIPKIGYKHVATRVGSLFDTYLKTMPIEERKFWFETATKESNFMNDRPVNYLGATPVNSKE